MTWSHSKIRCDSLTRILTSHSESRKPLMCIIRPNFISQNYFVLTIVLRQHDLSSKKIKRLKTDPTAIPGDPDA